MRIGDSEARFAAGVRARGPTGQTSGPSNSRGCQENSHCLCPPGRARSATVPLSLPSGAVQALSSFSMPWLLTTVLSPLSMPWLWTGGLSPFSTLWLFTWALSPLSTLWLSPASAVAGAGGFDDPVLCSRLSPSVAFFQAHVLACKRETLTPAFRIAVRIVGKVKHLIRSLSHRNTSQYKQYLIGHTGSQKQTRKPTEKPQLVAA